jgi:hypothetical protein
LKTISFQEEANSKPLQLTKKPRQASFEEAAVAVAVGLDKCKSNGELIYALNQLSLSLPTTVIIWKVCCIFKFLSLYTLDRGQGCYFKKTYRLVS